MIIHEPAKGQQEISLTPARQETFVMLNFGYMKNLTFPLLFLLAFTGVSFAEGFNTTTDVTDTTPAVEQQPAAPVATPADIKTTPEFKSVQTKVMANPEVLGDIQKLLDDPEVMALFSDPSFLAAVQSGNTAALSTDPRLQTLSENPKVQALIQKIRSQQ